MKMKQTGAVLTAAVMLLLCGCSDTDDSSDAYDPSQGIVTAYDEASFDAGFAECIKTYFEAVQAQDFEGYQATVYRPYQTAYGAYLETKGKTLEESFASLATQFDEDGYESWTFTDLELAYYEGEDVDDFFETWVSLGIFDDQFVADCKAEAIAIHDVQFTLYAQYEGDDYTVPVVQGGEMMMIQTTDGYFLFG